MCRWANMHNSTPPAAIMNFISNTCVWQVYMSTVRKGLLLLNQPKETKLTRSAWEKNWRGRSCCIFLDGRDETKLNNTAQRNTTWVTHRLYKNRTHSGKVERDGGEVTEKWEGRKSWRTVKILDLFSAGQQHLPTYCSGHTITGWIHFFGGLFIALSDGKGEKRQETGKERGEDIALRATGWSVCTWDTRSGSTFLYTISFTAGMNKRNGNCDHRLFLCTLFSKSFGEDLRKKCAPVFKIFYSWLLGLPFLVMFTVLLQSE